MHAILCHASYLGMEQQSRMDKAILAVDKLVGLVTAVALVRPSKPYRGHRSGGKKETAG
jgi:predicted hydrolase (HD superfamily)